MRVLHSLPSADPKSGGPAGAVRQLAELLVARGHEVEVATMDSPDVIAQCDFSTKLIGLGPGVGVYGYSSKMMNWMNANMPRFDLLVINAIWQFNALAAYRANTKARIPYVVFTHGMLDPYFKEQHPLKHLKKSIYYALFLRDILSNAKAVCFTAEEEKILARESFSPYQVNECVVPYGILGPQCDLTKAGHAFIERFPQLRGKRIALSLGRIHPKKATDVLIDAFAATLAEDPKWQLVIAGPDQIGWQKKLEEQAARLGIMDRITWTGMLYGDMKWGAFAASEIFAIPSHQENFGIVVAEALATGLPVLMSNKVNIWREVASCNAGLVEPDTALGAIQLFRQWSGLSSEQTQAMRQNAVLCFKQHFDLQAVGNDLVYLFEEFAGVTAHSSNSAR